MDGLLLLLLDGWLVTGWLLDGWLVAVAAAGWIATAGWLAARSLMFQSKCNVVN